MEPIPTEVSPGKISMCSIICNVHAYMYVCTYYNYSVGQFNRLI